MKYIREVSPLFKKPSMVADLPWEGTRSHSPSFSGDELPKHGPSTKDRKVIPLKMSFITRNLTIPDLENRCVCVSVCVYACVIYRESIYSSFRKGPLVYFMWTIIGCMWIFTVSEYGLK